MALPQDFEANTDALTTYDNIVEEQCWFDECNCDHIPVADCEGLVHENNKGVGRFACMMQGQSCYNPKFFSSFMKKLTCQLDHYIQNICALWDMVECIRDYVKNLGDMGTVTDTYLRNSYVSSADFYHTFTDEYDLSIYMDSTTGVVAGESDDQRRKLTDRKYRVFIRWCADGTSLDPASDNTLTMTVYHSGETFTQEMETKRSVHWQMTGCSDSAMEMCDSIIVPAGQYVKLRVSPKSSSPGIFRVHNFKVEYTPIIDAGELPDCLKDRP